MRRIIRRLLLGAGLVGALAVAWPRPPAAGRQADALPAPMRHDKWMGVATCSSTACHNANGPRSRPLRSEYSIWAAEDRHAHAFQVLYDERSERMVRLLYGDKARATETKRCLACHAMNDGDKSGTGPRFSFADGIGCESCHGAAERWLTVHYQDGFRAKSAEAKEALGLRNLKGAERRARLCVECHVGTGDKDVNHDLIAAGHPRLNFEYAAFLSVYPKHWDVAPEKGATPDLAAREWAVGQIVTAQASLELLKARAKGATKDSAPWPEFAEYNCFACHKDLKADSPRQKAGFGDRKAGSLPWGTWYLSMILPYAKASDVALKDSIPNLRKQMERSRPDPTAVVKDADALIGELQSWLRTVTKSETMTPGDVRRLMREFAGQGVERKEPMNWDEATQFYLALAALHQGLGDLTKKRPPAAVTEDLLAIRKELKGAFEKGFDSPRKFDPMTFRKELLDLGKHLGD